MRAMAAGSGAAPDGVGETAIGAAMMRARESGRADPLFEDPFAMAFVEAAPPIFENGPSAEDDPQLALLEAAFEDAVSVRTRFYDEFLLGRVASGVHQVVLLGAGLDTRAFRLNWPGHVRLFEIDMPEVLAFKEQVLARAASEPNCERVVVVADLSGDWTARLRDAGFRSNEPTAWAAEGLFPYLTDDDAQELLREVAKLSNAGTTLAIDQPTIPEDSLLAQAQAMKDMEAITSMWKGGMREDAEGWLSRHGWQVELFAGTALAARYRRSHSAVVGNDFLIATRLE